MLEDQSEETACLHVLGLLDPTEDSAFAASFPGDPKLADTVRDLNETLTNLSSSTTSIRLPSGDLKDRVLDLVDLVPPRVWTDPEGRITEINSAFTGLCGYGFQEVSGRKPGNFLQGRETDPATIDTLRSAVREVRETNVEMLNYHKDGTPYWVAIHLRPQRDEQGAVTGFEAEETKLPFPA